MLDELIVPRIDGLERLTLVGQGGFASVYSAYEVSLDRTVAVKVLSAIDERSVERFLHEVRVMGALTGHPNIAPIFRSGRAGDGRAFLVMPLYQEGSLHDLVGARGALELSELLRIGVILCGATQTIHNSGIVHGDLKPSNVLFTAYLDPVLTDFGIAVATGEETSGPLVALTPEYSPPEVLRDEARPSPAGDVFSLALTLAVAGGHRTLMSGESLGSLLERRMSGEHLDDHLDEGFRSALVGALDADPQARPSAEEFGEILRALQQRRQEPTTELLVLGRQQGQHGVKAGAAGDARPPSQPAGRTLSVEDLTRLRLTHQGPHTVLPGLPPLPPPMGQWPSPGRPVAGPPPMGVRAGAPTGPPMFPPGTAPPRGVDATARRGRAARALTWSARSIAHLLLLPIAVLASTVRRFRTPRAPRVPPPTGPVDPLAALLADRPSPVDSLETRPVIEGLARVLNDAGTALPLSVALTGRWGAGKSSAMLQLEHRLRATEPGERSWIPVWFDAWRFQSRDALWAGIARAMFRQGLAQRRHAWQRLCFRARFAARRVGWWRIAWATGLALGAIAWFVTTVVKHKGDGVWPAVSGVGAGVIGLGAALGLVDSLGDPFRRVMGPLGVFRRFRPEGGPSDEAEHDITTLLSCLTIKPGTAVIVFLDDLDRCAPQVIREALVCVAEIFGRAAGDPIVFVLGVDMDLVVSVIENDLASVRTALAKLNPERVGPLGRQFVEKIFQLQVSLESTRRLPTERLVAGSADAEIDGSRLRSFLEDLRELPAEQAAGMTIARRAHGLGTVDVDVSDLRALRAAVRIRRSELLASRSDDLRRAEREVITALRLTPRAVKRLDNTFRLQLQIAANTPGCELGYEAADLLALAKWTALRLHFPSTTAAIASRVGLWEQLETLLVQGARDAVQSQMADLMPDSAEIQSEFINLLALGLPSASVRRVPLHSFADVV